VTHQQINSVVRDSVTLARALIRWYRANRRDLPWRPSIGTTARVDPYAVLISEFMLQQTQVATVRGYFERFMARWPTLGDLAAASEQDVLRQWQGLGYYSRARNLHAAVRQIAAEFGGQVPSDVTALMGLPGIGRYTAGAIASIAFDCAAPILDGNVARVICRLEKIEDDPRCPETVKRLWAVAEQLLPRRNCGEFNSALMELGATICTPRQPNCEICPVKQFCRAFADGVQDKIPLPRKSREIPIVRRWTICIGSGGRWLLHRRPASGRWAGLWEFSTVPAESGSPRIDDISAALGVANLGDLKPLGQIRHALTHRRYIFDAFRAVTGVRVAIPEAKWIRLQELDRYPLSRPQLRIAQMLRDDIPKPLDQRKSITRPQPTAPSQSRH